MAKVWSGKLDCTFHGKMHWELNKEMWFRSEAANEHYDHWKKMGVKITQNILRESLITLLPRIELYLLHRQMAHFCVIFQLMKDDYYYVK